MQSAEYTYNASNQILREILFNGRKHSVIFYRYDKDGNRIAKTGTSGKNRVVLSYLYSVENRLKAVYNGKELLMAAAYDGDGNRIFQLNYHEKDDYGSQNRNGILFPVPQKTGALEQELMDLIKTPENEKNYELIQYVNDINREHTEVLMELNGNGMIEHAYSYGVNRLSSDRFTKEVSYYHYDPRGCVTGVTDENAVLWQTYGYEPFGNFSHGKPRFGNVYGYNGESYNPNTESQYLRARYYNTTIGSFYSEDQYLGNVLDPLSLNRYHYCKSNPLGYKEPSGHRALRVQFTALSSVMLQGIEHPVIQQTEQLILNLNPGFGALLDSDIARKTLLSLTGQINKLTNQYIQEPDLQKRKSKLEEMIEKVASLSTMLCGELNKSKTKALTDYLDGLKKLLGLYAGLRSVPSDVLSLMNSPIDSTWGISDSTAEAWFLSTNTAVIQKYGLNSTNIGRVTAAIKAAGVSPVFFYAYTVNEGGGLGGFINHYGVNYYVNNGGDTAVNAASGDAQYLAAQSKIMNSKPAWVDLGQKPPLRIDFVPQTVKDSGNTSFASMPSGSIGRAYIPATAAATWEVYYPDGLLKSYNQVQNYGAPMKGVLSFIVAMSKY